MTNWITLHSPREKTPRSITTTEGTHYEYGGAEPFHLRADIITEIVPAGTETVIRTSTGGQYVCGETAPQVLEMVSGTVR